MSNHPPRHAIPDEEPACRPPIAAAAPMAEQAENPHIVILGGGFAGCTLARALERTVARKARVTLLSQDNFITYNPLLPEVVGASILPSHVVAPIRQMLKRTEFRMVAVTGIDPRAREISYLGEGSGVIGYDHLVLAFGTSASLDLLPGMAKYALPLKTLGDALFLRNRVVVRLEQAELQDDREARRWLTTFVVVGGGFSGVEVAGEINDFLLAVRGYYGHCETQDFRVVLLHGSDRLLPELPARLGEFAARKMRSRGIDVRLRTRVTRIDDRGVLLDDGDRLATGTVVCTIGTRENPLVAELGLPLERNRIRTEPDMSVPGYSGLWAIGDCAAVPNARDRGLCPPTAQFATRQATQLAANLSRVLARRPTRAFAYRSQGQLSAIGHNRAVAQIGGVLLSGFAAWLLWRGVYLLKIPTLARKVRVFFEWNWGMLFPPDLVHLRFAQTRRRSAKTVDANV